MSWQYQAFNPWPPDRWAVLLRALTGVAIIVLTATPVEAAGQVELIAPSDGATYAVGEPLELAVLATAAPGAVVERVDYLVYGSRFVSATEAPFAATLDGLRQGLHVLRARRVDDDGGVAYSEPVAVRVGLPTDGVLLVVGNRNVLLAGDTAVRDRLAAFGYDVEVVGSELFSDDPVAAAAAVDGKAFVALAQSARPSKIRDYFLTHPVPVVCWSYEMFSELGMTGTGPGQRGERPRIERLRIDASTDILAAGLDGTVSAADEPTAFVWGSPSAEATVVATFDGEPERVAFFVYDTGAAMTGGPAPARRVGLFLSQRNPAHLTHEGWMLAEVAFAWAAGFAPLPEELPIEVAIRQPEDGATVVAGTAIPVVVDARPAVAIERLELWINGGLATTLDAPPYEVLLPPLGEGLYRLRARAVGQDRQVDSLPVAITVGSPGRDVLVVVAGPPNIEDRALADRLAGLGLTVATVAATDFDPVASTSLVVLAPSLAAGDLAAATVSDLAETEVPVLVLEGELYEGLGLVAPGDSGTAPATDSLVIEPNLQLLGGSPLAAGFDGEVMVFETPQPTRWGRPSPDAVLVAGTPEVGRDPAIFGYRAGDVAPVGTVPARRVGFFVADGPLDLSADGWALFDAVALWVLGFDAANRPPSVTLDDPVVDTVVSAGAPIALTATASDADGTVERVLFLANGRVVAQADAPPFTATWSGASDGLYRLSALAVDDDGASAESPSLRLQVGTPVVDALLVVADPAALDPAEQAMADRLTALGLMITTVDTSGINAVAVDGSALAGTALVMVSSTVDATSLDPALAAAAVPVATWNGEVFALLGLTASSDDGGFFELDDRIELYPLAGPLTPSGLGSPFPFTDRPATWLLGVPVEGARVGAGLGLAAPGEGIPLAVFGYDTGDALADGTAPARRLALPLTTDATGRLTDAGSRLVDTALAWVLDHLPPALDTTGPTVDVVSPRAITYLDPEITEDLYRVEVAYADGGSGIDPASLDLLLRRDGEPFFDLDPVCTVATDGARCPMPVLSVGSFELEVGVADHAGNSTVVSRGFVVDSTTDLAPPVLSVSRPSAGPTHVADPAVVFEGTAGDDDELAQVLVGGQPTPVVGGVFQHVYDLPTEGGPFEVSVLALDVVGRSTEFVATLVYDATPPVLEIFEPQPSDAPLLVSDATLTVRGRVEEENLDRVEVGGMVAPVDDDGFFEAVVPLDPGPVDLEIRASDLAGNETFALLPVLRSDPALVTITGPADGTLIAGGSATVTGTVDRPVEQVLVAGILAEVDGLGFSATAVPLVEGGNLITAVAYDAVGVATSATVTIHRDTEPPAMAVTHPADGARVSGSTVVITGVVRDYSNAGLGLPTVAVAGMPAQVSGDSFRAEVPLAAGVQTLPVVATDAAGNQSTAAVVVEGVPAVGTATIRRVSGSAQSATVGSPLAQPLVVELLDADGQPAADRRVIFEIVSSNGRLAGGMVGNDRGRVVLSDAAGRAAVDWTLGTRAGHHDRVRATAVGFEGEVSFLANAQVGAASALVIDFGNYQTGAVSRELPWPLRVAVTDDFQNPVPGAEVRYTVIEGGGQVDGGSEAIRITGEDGRAGATLELGPVEYREGNIVLTELVSEADGPVVFLATGLVPGEALTTAIGGIVLDNTDQPVPGVTLSIDHSSATAVTDSEGRFVIESVPVGHVHLVADGSTTSRLGDWPMLSFEMVTVSGRFNAMDRPIYLLPLRVDEGLAIGPGTGGTLTLPDIPGFALEIEPGSATFGDGGPSGVVSVAVVHADKVPMAPNYGQNPGMVLTIQPPDVHFDPPARITLPNVDALPPGAIGDIFSFRHDLGEFVAIGPASVSEDGTVLTSGEGVGIAAGGWHFTPPKPQPRPSGDGCGNCPQCKTKCFQGQCVTGVSDLYQPCDDGVECTEDDTCRPQGLPSGGTKCQGDKIPDSVVDRFDFKSDLVNKMTQAIDRLIGLAKPIAPCKPSGFKAETSGRIETVRTCCEELGGFALAGRGSANGTLGTGLQACMIPGASLSLGEKLKIGAHTNLTFQLRVQASVANDPCDGEPECPLGLKFAGTVKVAAEGGAIVQVVDPKAFSAQGVFRAEFTLGVSLDCKEVDLSGTLGPLSMVVRVSLLDGFQFTHFWEIPHTRIDF